MWKGFESCPRGGNDDGPAGTKQSAKGSSLCIPERFLSQTGQVSRLKGERSQTLLGGYGAGKSPMPVVVYRTRRRAQLAWMLLGKGSTILELVAIEDEAPLDR